MTPTPEFQAFIERNNAIAAAEAARIEGDWILARLNSVIEALDRPVSEDGSAGGRQVFAFLMSGNPRVISRAKRLYHKRRFQLWKRAQADADARLGATLAQMKGAA